VAELGIEPSKELQELERLILRQDPALDPAPPAKAKRTLLVVGSTDRQLDGLLSVAEPLARRGDRELIVGRLVEDADELVAAALAVNHRCASLAVAARGAAFTVLEPERDVVRLANSYDVELVLLGDGAVAALEAVTTRSPADLAVLFGPSVDWGRGEAVFVPFGGAENEWAALELGAWLASSMGTPLRLVGTAADPSRGRRDASRLLADASIAVQRVIGVAAEPLLVEPVEEALVAAVGPATVVVAGFPERRATELGSLRQALIGVRRSPVLLVHRGTRPGGLAPRDSWTRFSWSLQP
jgi:hypothetical protein